MNQLITIENALPAVSQIKGTDSKFVGANTAAELDLWSGFTEHNSIVRPTLEEYWKPYHWNGDPDVPWSAVFISYLLQNDNFKGSPQHLQYVKNVINGESPEWVAFSIPKNQGKIHLNIGDVLVRPRSGSDTATHGDIVWKIEGGKAYLAGGNLGNTAKSAGTFNVDPNGKVNERISNYLVILKKKGSYMKAIPILIVLGAGALWWTLKK